MADGLMDAETRALCRPPGTEVIPQPEPYKAVVFHAFFEAGLRFPIEDFLGEVLERFNIQIHQLTPNAIARLGVFAMAMKMMGCRLSIPAFLKFYESHCYVNTGEVSVGGESITV